MSHFRPGDSVTYVGKKTFKDDKGNPFSLNGKLGEVCADIRGTEKGVVVDFGDHSFVMSEDVLVRGFRPQKDTGDSGVEVTHRRRRSAEDED